MDHAHTWRFRPPMPPPPPYAVAAPPPPSVANLCPICAIHHFPFCPSPYSQTPGMPFHDQFYPYHPPPPPQQPPPLPPLPPLPPQPQPQPPHTPYDPFLDHQHVATMNPPPPRPWTGNTNSNPNSSFNRELYGYSNTSFDYAHAGTKRMRVHESVPGPDPSWRSNLDATPRFIAEDERRLKLIREHGGFGTKSSNNFNSGTFPNPNYSTFNRDESYSNRNIELRRSGYNNSKIQQHNFDQRAYHGQPPLPPSPPPPLPVEPPGRRFPEPVINSPGSLFPVTVSSSSPSVSETNFYSNKVYPSNSFRESELSPQPKVVDASHLLKHPHRTTRPDHIVIILRGLPGSGKSYLAKMLRDLEVENGGNAPRIHTMDDYFMTEVEKVDEIEGSKPGKKLVKKTVMEYCYEPEMEEAYRSSMLKAFKKTLDEGGFSFVIVDDRNLRVADFAQFWAVAKRSGYEVYLLEATYNDPVGCAARNIHGFTHGDIQKMADQWEEATSLYLKLDIKSLLHGDNTEECGIQEVDMDTEDEDVDNKNHESVKTLPVKDLESNDTYKDETRWDHQIEEVKELGKSKWSNDFDEDQIQNKHKVKDRKVNSLSGLIKSYSKEGKTVRWGDKVANKGFSIGAAKLTRASSLVIGPGAGYNLKTNPLNEEDKFGLRQNSEGQKGKNVFKEQLREEHESFKAVFDKRKHRIGVNDE